MKENMNNIIAAATILVPFVMGLTQLIKSWAKGIDGGLVNLISLIIASMAGALFGYTLDQANLIYYIWGGFLLGLSATGLYEGLNKVIIKNRKDGK